MKQVELSKRFIIMGLISGLISAVLLYSSPDTRSIGDRTFSGLSEPEIQYISIAKTREQYGFIFLGISFVLQIVGLLIEKSKKSGE